MEITPGLQPILILSERDERLKAVVAQIVGRHAVLLTENGTFTKVKNQRYRPGQQITFCQKRKPLVRPLVMAASIMLLFLSGTFLALARLPYSYVSIDVNPSIEYTLNWFDRVLSLRAVNEDAQPIVKQLAESGVVNQPIDIAIDMTIKSLDDMQYFLDDAENDVVIAAASLGLKNVNSLTGKLKNSAGSVLHGRPLAVTAFQTDRNKIREAQQYHTTAGRLVIVENLASSGDGFHDEAKEEWLKKPVREILNHQNGKKQPQMEENKPANPEDAIDHTATAGVSPAETESPPPTSPEKTDAPKKTNAPEKTDAPKQDHSNTDKDKKPDATPNDKDKPKNTPEPKNKEQGPKASTPPNGGNNGQEKKNETSEGLVKPNQSLSGLDQQKGKP